ncbi:acyltransferase [Wenzhouxiangella sp. EGI_FJ10409]|uniref:acyltransferase n=1 Tax=Wenzhouxiangella sp. EGI_FJ10409 TaxID=3243767 RepID=UPI0035DC1E84
MFKKLIALLRIVAASLLLAANSVVHILPLLVVALVKLVLRFAPVTRGCNHILSALAASWIGFNSWLFDHLTSTRVNVDGLPDADMRSQVLLICNHQSWVDIPVLQKLFNRRLPLLRFFLKSQLIWVPLLGLAWWALDFPFMKRYSRAQIERRPELAGRDITATRRACRKFRHMPVAIVNFVEGTRFTPDKHAAQGSPYQRLLKPRAGGTAFTLDAMGDALDTLVDVTIAYPDGRPSLADLFANRVREIRVRVRTLPIPADLRGGDYQADPEFRRRFQEWINQLWLEKDACLQELEAP